MRFKVSHSFDSTFQATIEPFQIAGTARDVSFLIDFLPAYLYPDGERQIKQWGVIGVSLGGHSTWIALKDGRCFAYIYVGVLSGLTLRRTPTQLGDSHHRYATRTVQLKPG